MATAAIPKAASNIAGPSPNAPGSPEKGGATNNPTNKLKWRLVGSTQNSDKGRDEESEHERRGLNRPQAQHFGKRGPTRAGMEDGEG